MKKYYLAMFDVNDTRWAKMNVVINNTKLDPAPKHAAENLTKGKSNDFYEQASDDDRNNMVIADGDDGYDNNLYDGGDNQFR